MKLNRCNISNILHKQIYNTLKSQRNVAILSRNFAAQTQESSFLGKDQRRPRIIRESPDAGNDESQSDSSSYDEAFPKGSAKITYKIPTDDHHLWLQFQDKNIYILGVFHHHNASVFEVANTIDTFKPDTVMIELCPWRGKRLADVFEMYPHHIVTKDVERTAYVVARRHDCNIVFGDIAEHLLTDRLKQIAPDIAADISRLGYHEISYKNRNKKPKVKKAKWAVESDETKTKDDTSEGSTTGDDDGELEESDFYTRSKLRRLIAQSDLPSEAKTVLYDDRERHMVKSLMRCEGDKIVAVVGMAHLDGMEKLWLDENFWMDEKWWNMESRAPWWERLWTRFAFKHYY